MTEPNIVRTHRQRIDQGNPGTWAGPLPTRYRKSVVFNRKMHHDRCILHHD